MKRIKDNKILQTLFSAPVGEKELLESVNEMFERGTNPVHLYIDVNDYLFELRDKKKVALNN